jgi:hypothetical protein
MKKIIELDDYFPTGEATVQTVLTYNNGRSVDTSRITKHASEALDYIKSVVPEPGKTIMLVNALGAEETWGPNRNHDGFPEFPVPAKLRGKTASAKDRWFIEPGQELTKHYKSFETNPAHTFKHHCFPAGTLVTMSNHDRLPIEKVKVGSAVLTLEGARKVTGVMSRQYEGPGISLRLEGEYNRLVGTADHPVLIYRRQDLHCPHKYNYLQPKFGCRAATCQAKAPAAKEPRPVWAPLSSVVHGDYLFMPGPKHGEQAVTPEFARLVGWVASEGYLSKDRYSIQFTFGKDNHADIQSVTKCLRENGLHVTKTPTKHNTVALSSCSRDMHARLSKYVTGIKAAKKLTSKTIRWSAALLHELLYAYIDGDGHVCASGRNNGQLRIRSSSPQMLRMLSDIIRSLGVPATVQWDTAPGWMLSPTNAQYYWANGSGVVAIEKTYVPFISRGSRKAHTTPNKRAPHVKNFQNGYLVRVTDVQQVKVAEPVYNLEVDGPHHSVANEVVVHNCNKDPAKASGVVKKAFWNPRMHRVELLISVDNDKDPEWVKRANDGEFPAVSMGTRIPWDSCSRCGNRAKTRADYCEHAKYAMGEIDEHGFKNYVHNPSPDFFDISRVFRPADRTGYTLKKVAQVHEVRLSADLAADNDILAAKAAAATKLSDIDKIIRGEPVATSTLSPDEKSLIIKFRDHVGGKLASSDVRFGNCVPYPLGEVLSAAAMHGVILKDAEFIPLAASKLAGKHVVLTDGVVAKTAAAARYAVELFADDPALLDEILDSRVLESEKVASYLIDLFSGIREKRAYVGDYLYRRLVPEGVGMRPDAAPTTDILHAGPYQTTRGAAIDAQDAVTRAHVGKVLGGSAMLLGGYKALTAFPALRKFKLPIAAGMGYAGYKALAPRPGGTIQTDEGYNVPDITEMVGRTASVESIASLVENAADRRSCGHVTKIAVAGDAESVATALGAVITGNEIA